MDTLTESDRVHDSTPEREEQTDNSRTRSDALSGSNHHAHTPRESILFRFHPVTRGGLGRLRIFIGHESGDLRAQR